MYGWMGGCVGVWMGGCVGVWVGGWIDGWVVVCMGETYMKVQIDEPSQ